MAELLHGIQIGTQHIPFSEVHDRFTQTEFGAQLLNNIRYSPFKPELVTNRQWEHILGMDVNNLHHLALSGKITDRFLNSCANPHTNWGRTLSSEAEFSPVEQNTLRLTAWVHDWGEAVVGDINYNDKTEEDEKREMVVLRTLMGRILGDYDNQAAGEELFINVEQILTDRSTKLGRAFNAIERGGYLRTGIRAWNQSFKYTDEISSNLIALSKQVVSNHFGTLEQYADIYPPVDLFLSFHKKTIEMIQSS